MLLHGSNNRPANRERSHATLTELSDEGLRGRAREYLCLAACGAVKHRGIFHHDEIKKPQVRTDFGQVLELAPGHKNQLSARSLKASQRLNDGPCHLAMGGECFIVVTSQG